MAADEITEEPEAGPITQDLYRPALRLGQNAEDLYQNGKYDQVGRMLYFADFCLQFLLFGTQDSAADAARENSLADPDQRPLLDKVIKHARPGMKLADSEPRQALAALQIAAFYLKCAEHWEPATDDEKTRQEFEKLHGLIQRQTAKAEATIAALPSEEP